MKSYLVKNEKNFKKIMAPLFPTFETKIFAKITSSVETVKFPVKNMKVNNVHTTKLTLNPQSSWSS